MARRREDAMKDLRTHAGFPIKPVYGPDDLTGRDVERDVGRPGEYPFTRGIHAYMYHERLWTMRQYIGFGTPAETNARFKYLMAHGQDALNVAFDLPTQLGLDSDDPRADGEVGRVGMAIDTLADMEEAFAGIPLDRVSVSLTINGMAAPITAMYFAVAAEQGAARDRIVTTPQNDILKEFAARVVQLHRVGQDLRGGGQVPGRAPALRAHGARALRGNESEVVDVPHAHRRRRLRVRAAGAREQHRAWRLHRAGRGAVGGADDGVAELPRGLQDPDGQGAAHRAQ